MKIEIFYCVVWNYEPHAAGLAAELKKAIGLDSELFSGKRGDFEVTVDGEKVFSKQKLSRFPELGEVLKIIKKWLLRKKIPTWRCMTVSWAKLSLNLFQYFIQGIWRIWDLTFDFK